MESSEMFQKPFWEQPESRRLEFKEAFPKGEPIARTAVAFANGGGGKIIFGVRDNPRQVIGIPDDEIFPLQERVAESIFTRCAPNIVPELSIRTVEEKNLVIVEIFPGSHKPYYIKKQGKHQGDLYSRGFGKPAGGRRNAGGTGKTAAECFLRFGPGLRSAMVGYRSG